MSDGAIVRPPRGGVEVYDKQAGHVRYVSPEEAEQGVLAGRMQAKAAIQIRRGNEVRTLDDPAELAEAKAYGWAVTDDAGAYKARVAREEDTVAGQVRGTAEGVLSGVTMGASDVLLGGAKNSEQRLRYQSRNKAAGELADAGRLVGEVAPVVLSGGGSLGVKAGAAGIKQGVKTGGRAGVRQMLGGAAKIATRAPVALERGGMAIEQGISRLAGGGLRGRVLGGMGRGVGEGFVSGVGQAVHEGVLGDRDLTGEYLLAAGGMSALMGGGMGAAFPLVGKAAGATAALPVKATKRVLGAVEGMSPDGSVIGHMAQTLASGKRSGPFFEQLSMIASKEGNDKMQRVLHRQDEVLEEIGTKIRSASEEYNAMQAKAVAAFERDRSGNFGKLLDDTGDGAIQRMVSQDVEGVIARLDEHLAVAKDPAYRRKFDQLALDRSAASLNLLRDGVAAMPASKVYHGMVRTLRDVQEQLTRLRKSGKEPDTVDMLVDVEGRLKGALSSDKYGGAGSAFKETATADALYFEVAEKAKGSAAGRLLDRGKLSTNRDALEVAKSHGDFKAADRTGALQEALEADLQAMRKRAEYSDSAELKAAVAKMEGAKTRWMEALDGAAENAQILGRQRELNRTPLSGALAAAGPSGLLPTAAVLGGVPGMLVGGAIAMAARPGSTIRTLSAIRHAVDAAGVDIDRVIRRVTTSGSKAGDTGAARVGSLRKLARAKRKAKTASRLGRRASLRVGAQAQHLRSQEQREKARRAAELANPERLAQVLARDMFDLMDAAPDLGGAMSERVHAAAEFLADKLPPESVDPLTGEVSIVDDVTRDRFDRYYEAVTDPIATLKKLETGRFTSEHSEAIRTVWPRLFEDMQTRVFQQLAEAADRGEPLPMSSKVSLGVLFDLVTDPSMSGTFQAQKAAAVGAQPQEPPQPQGQQPASPKRARKVSMKTPMTHATSIGRIERSDV